MEKPKPSPPRPPPPPPNPPPMGKPMLRVGLLAWATSCVGLGCAVAADKREVPDVDQYVEKSIVLFSRIRVYYHNEDMG